MSRLETKCKLRIDLTRMSIAGSVLAVVFFNTKRGLYVFFGICVALITLTHFFGSKTGLEASQLFSIYAGVFSAIILETIYLVLTVLQNSNRSLQRFKISGGRSCIEVVDNSIVIAQGELTKRFPIERLVSIRRELGHWLIRVNDEDECAHHQKASIVEFFLQKKWRQIPLPVYYFNMNIDSPLIALKSNDSADRFIQAISAEKPVTSSFGNK